MIRWVTSIGTILVANLIPELFYTFAEDQKICQLIASAEQIVSFGRDGKDGIEGENGEKGKDSETLTIFADGSPLNLNLSGQKGLSGQNGENGSNAICENQPVNVNYNLWGASGGDGGNGGNGGDGGDGGSLTIYATDKSYLSQIYVEAGGGQGGESGQGGTGGIGCQCPQPFWTVESCSGRPGSPDYSCSTREYRCLGGDAGKNGRAGRVGRDGKLGSLTLINSRTPLAPDRLTASVTMSVLKERGFSLSKNIWETKTGAVSLFAEGSVIDDQYLELVERAENSVVLIWNAPQDFAPFRDRTVTLNLQDDRSVTMNFPDDIWLETSILPRNNVTELFVFNAIRANQATELESKGLSGVGLGLKLDLVDKAQKSDLISTSFYLKYSVSNSGEARFRNVSDYIVRFEGEVPPEFVNYSGNEFTINIGELPIEPQYLEIDRAVQIQLEITRTFGDNSAKQTITEKEILGPFN